MTAAGRGPPQGRASVVDLGFNSVKMTNYYVWPDRSYKPYHQESASVRLGDGLYEGAVRPKYIERAVEALRMFRSIVQFEQIEYEVAVATSAVREASNGDLVLDQIRKHTGFEFRVLSERQEAEYAFVGAMRALSVESCAFFDLGGGSLEMVRSDRGQITDVRSLPLGALKLTRESGGVGPARERVRSSLPSAEDLGMRGGEPLIGAGGAARALAKYDQHLRDYPLAKAHGYRMGTDRISEMAESLASMTPDKISKLGPIGRARSETIAAGACVITELAAKLGAREVVVSAHGLREGVLAASLCGNPAGSPGSDYARAMGSAPPELPPASEALLGALSAAKAVSEREARLLREALGQTGRLSEFRDAGNVLSSVLDDDSALDHRDQLLVALSLVSSKKRRRAESLASLYGDMLEKGDVESAKRMGSVVAVCDLLHRTGARAEAEKAEGGVRLSVRPPDGSFPALLLGRACSRMKDALGAEVLVSVKGAEIRAQGA